VLLTEKTPVPALICYPVFWFNFSAICCKYSLYI
jgi:hypothetical protein